MAKPFKPVASGNSFKPTGSLNSWKPTGSLASVRTNKDERGMKPISSLDSRADTPWRRQSSPPFGGHDSASRALDTSDVPTAYHARREMFKRARSEISAQSSTAIDDTDIEYTSEKYTSEGKTPIMRRDKHLKTVGNLVSEARREEIVLNPEDLAELHAMHEDFVAMQQSPTRSCSTCYGSCETVVTLSREVLEKSWGQSGSWHMHGNCPKSKENPHNDRKFIFWPNGESGIFESWELSAANTKGCKGLADKTPGQDNLSVSRLPFGWEIFCVMDGHGPDGHWPATRAVTVLPYILQSDSCKAMLKHGQAEAALLHAFSHTENDLIQRSVVENVDLHSCGCTACCVIRNPDSDPYKLWVATAGDSRAVLFAPGHGVLNETIDHKPTLEGEQQRLEQMGCEIKITEHADHVETRIFIKGRSYPGLCMSRCFGDLLVKGKGVVPDPVIEQWSWEGVQGAMLLAASDGIWEFIDSDKAAQTIISAIDAGKSYDSALSQLIKEAKMEWTAHEGASYCDDVTAVLLPLDAGPAPTAAGGEEAWAVHSPT